MKTIDDVAGGGEGAAPGLASALAISGAVEAAESRVKGIRRDLEQVNGDFTLACLTRQRSPSSSALDDAVRTADAAVKAVELRLREAMAAMAAAREKFSPAFQRQVAPYRADAGREVLVAVEHIERAREILAAVEKYAASHGLEVGQGLRLLPHPRDLRRVGERLVGKARK
jgi:hypothetical protein